MIKILQDLKKSDRKLYAQVVKQLEQYGGVASKGYYNRLTYPDFIELISFSNSYTFLPNEYDAVLGVLSDLNPTENDLMRAVSRCKPEHKKALMQSIHKSNNRCRQRVLKIIDDLAQPTPSFLQSLKSVFS